MGRTRASNIWCSCWNKATDEALFVSLLYGPCSCPIQSLSLSYMVLISVLYSPCFCPIWSSFLSYMVLVSVLYSPRLCPIRSSFLSWQFNKLFAILIFHHPSLHRESFIISTKMIKEKWPLSISPSSPQKSSIERLQISRWRGVVLGDCDILDKQAICQEDQVQ